MSDKTETHYQDPKAEFDAPEDDHRLSLTAEEIEALKADDDSEGDAPKAGAKPSENDTKAESKPEGAKEGEGDGKEAKAKTEGEEPDPEAAAAAEGEEAEGEEAEPKVEADGEADPEAKDKAIDPGPAQIVDDPNEAVLRKWSQTDFESEAKKLAGERDALKKSLDEGEIGEFEAMEGLQKIHDRQSELQSQQHHVRMYQQRSEAADRQFGEAEEAFFAEEGNERFRSNPVLQDLLQNSMNRLAAHPDASGKSYLWLFNRARQAVDEAIAVAAAAPNKPEPKADPEPAEPKVEAKPDPNKPKPSRKQEQAERVNKVPEAISRLPEAENESGDSEFAHLDAMEITDMEHAFARMSDHEQQKFLREVSQ